MKDKARIENNEIWVIMWETVWIDVRESTTNDTWYN